MNKYLRLNLIFFLLMTLSIIPAYSQTNDDIAINEKINKIGFNKIYTQTSKEEIANFFKNHTDYSNSHDFEKLKNLYSDNYLNSDGFDKQIYFEMILKTWKQYPAVCYSTVIKDIDIDGDYAVVQTKEYAYGNTQESFENIQGPGLIQSDSYIFYYLQKFGKTWKITSNTVIYENTSLRYGDAKNMNFSLNVPTQIRAGEDYTSTLELDVPAKSFILASITNEPITYPQKQPKEVFRTIKKDGILERVFTANTDHYNEYSIASIGITKAAIVDKKSINIKVTGMAFVMKRINVLDERQPKQIQLIKDTKSSHDKN